MKKTMRRAPLADRLPVIEVVTTDVPKGLERFVGKIYTPDLHNEMREALKMAGADVGTDLDKVIAKLIPGSELSDMVAFEAAKKRAAPIKVRLGISGPTATDRLGDLFEDLGLPRKAPPYDGDYVLVDGNGRAFSLIDAFIEVTRRLRAAEARIADLEGQRR
jgi:hypothetical protein